MKIKYKIALFVFLVGSTVLFSTQAIHETISHKASIIDAQQNNAVLADEVSYHIETLLKEKVSKTKTLASAQILEQSLHDSNLEYGKYSVEERNAVINQLNQTWMATEDPEDPFVQQYLKNPTASFLTEQLHILPGEYGEIFLTNRFGAIIATTGKLTTLVHKHKQWWQASFNNGEGKVFIDDRGFDKSVQGYVIGIVVPVKIDNEIVGILKCNINIENELSNFVNQFSLRRYQGFLKIVRSGGLVVLEQGKGPLSSKIPDELIVKLKNKKKDVVNIVDDGTKYIVAYSPIELTLGSKGLGFGGTKQTVDQKKGNFGESWYAMVYRTPESVIEQLHKTDNMQVLMGVLTILLLAGIALILGGRVARPLALFSEAAQRIGDGHYDARINISSNDEIGKSALAFNKMVDQLKETSTSRDMLMKEHMRAAQLAVLGTVAAGVAHEINNPIQGILNYATLIKNTSQEKDRAFDLSQRIIRESDRIANITQNLLFYSKDNKGQFANVDICELIINALSLLETKVQLTGINLEISLPDNPLQISVIAQEIQQLVINLVDNSCDALKHKQHLTEEKSIKVSGHLEGHNESQFFILEVTDNGEGIPDSIKEKIKEPFFSTKPSTEGTGLGLSLVNEIVAKHNGRIEIESKEGEYAKFRVFLPVT